MNARKTKKSAADVSEHHGDMVDLEISDEEEEIFDDDLDIEKSLGIVNDLQRQLQSIRQLNRTLLDERNDQRNLHDSLVSVSDNQKNNIEELKKDIKQARGDYDKLVDAFGHSEEERIESVREISALKRDLKKVREINKGVNKKVKKLTTLQEEIVAEAKSHAKGLEETAKELRARQDQFEEKVDRRTKELFLAKATIHDLEENNKMLQSKIAYLEKSREALGRIQQSLREVHHGVLEQMTS